MVKKENKKISVYSYLVEEAYKKLDAKNEILTKKDVKLLNTTILYGQEEK